MNPLLKDLFLIVSLAITFSSLSFFLDYLFGHPGKQDGPNHNAIFFGWTLFLSKHRLKNTPMDKGTKNLLAEIESNYLLQHREDNGSAHPVALQNQKANLKLSLVTTARDFFTWEYAIGMCIYCTNVWLCIIGGTLLAFLLNLEYLPNVFLPLLLIIFSHTFLRRVLNES